MAKSSNKKMQPRSFQIKDLVLQVCRPAIITRKAVAKFQPKWNGPLLVTHAFTNEVYKIVNKDGL